MSISDTLAARTRDAVNDLNILSILQPAGALKPDVRAAWMRGAQAARGAALALAPAGGDRPGTLPTAENVRRALDLLTASAQAFYSAQEMAGVTGLLGDWFGYQARSAEAIRSTVETLAD